MNKRPDLSGREKPVDRVSTKRGKLRRIMQICFRQAPTREEYVLHGAQKPDLIASILVRGYVIFKRAADERLVIRDGIERKHVPQKPEKADVVIPLQSVHRPRGFVRKADVGRLKLILQDALQVDQLLVCRG